MQLIDEIIICNCLNKTDDYPQCNIKQALFSTQNMSIYKVNKCGTFIYISCKNIVKQALTTKYWQLLGLKNNNSNKAINEKTVENSQFI